MAQTVQNWEHHLAPLSQTTTTNRDVLLYEAAGLGPEDEHPPAGTPSHPDVSLPAQASFLLKTIRAAFGQDCDDNNTNEDNKLEQPIIVVDLAGFSLGGRIALATAVTLLGLPPGEQEQAEKITTPVIQIRKLHLTGVSLQRSDYGKLQLLSWKDHLQHDNLRAFAWSAVLASYSAPFLRRRSVDGNDDDDDGILVRRMIQGVCDSHTVTGLRALMEQAHPEEGPWSVAWMAQRLKENDNSSIQAGRLLVGQEDRMAPVDQVQALAAELGWDNNHAVSVVPGVGHAVPMEAPRAWREDLLGFLSSPSHQPDRLTALTD